MGWFKNQIYKYVVPVLGLESTSQINSQSPYNPYAYANDGLDASHGGYGESNVWSISVFDGEKDPGEMGAPRKILIDHASLRLRSWEAFSKSDVTQMIVGRHITWIVSAGLKLQLEPANLVLKNAGITQGTDKNFIRLIEEKFTIYAKSKSSTLSDRSNFHLEIKELKKNAIVGGDVLVRYHIKQGRPKIELIDGAHVKTPFLGDDFHKKAVSRGNVIRDGIELNPKTKEHIAFFVQNKNTTFTRISAKGSRTGRTQSFLYYGFKYRIDDNRGIPLLAAVLQTLKMLDRYKEATVGATEERAKIAYSIEHGKNSDGTNPIANMAKQATGQSVSDLGNSHAEGLKLAKYIVHTTNKQAFNMPVDSQLKKLSDDVDINFGDFFNDNIDIISATMQTPPAVAKSKYDTSYSSSRAALKDWEHTVKVERNLLTFFAYHTFFELWFQMEVLTGAIAAPQYRQALLEKNQIILDCFLNARFIGPNIPHIDPFKEVRAERAKLGELAKDAPLTTIAQATENLNEGDYWNNVIKFKDEVDQANELTPDNDDGNQDG